MSIRSFLERILSGGQEPTEPAKSVFGPNAERLRTKGAKAKANKLELMREKGRSSRGSN